MRRHDEPAAWLSVLRRISEKIRYDLRDPKGVRIDHETIAGDFDDQYQDGNLELRQVLTMVRSDCGQVWSGPKEVLDLASSIMRVFDEACCSLPSETIYRPHRSTVRFS